MDTRVGEYFKSFPRSEHGCLGIALVESPTSYIFVDKIKNGPNKNYVYVSKLDGAKNPWKNRFWLNRAVLDNPNHPFVKAQGNVSGEDTLDIIIKEIYRHEKEHIQQGEKAIKEKPLNETIEKKVEYNKDSASFFQTVFNESDIIIKYISAAVDIEPEGVIWDSDYPVILLGENRLEQINLTRGDYFTLSITGADYGKYGVYKPDVNWSSIKCPPCLQEMSRWDENSITQNIKYFAKASALSHKYLIV